MQFDSALAKKRKLDGDVISGATVDGSPPKMECKIPISSVFESLRSTSGIAPSSTVADRREQEIHGTQGPWYAVYSGRADRTAPVVHVFFVLAHAHNAHILQHLVRKRLVRDWSGWTARLDRAPVAANDAELQLFERALQSFSNAQFEVSVAPSPHTRFTGNLPESLLTHTHSCDTVSQLFVRSVAGCNLDSSLSAKDKKTTARSKRKLAPSNGLADAAAAAAAAQGAQGTGTATGTNVAASEEKTEQGCSCDILTDHVKAFGSGQQEKEMLHTPDEAAEREWDAHTQLYRDKYDKATDKCAGSKCCDGEAEMDEWAHENHDKYCCLKRHRNLAYVYECT